MRRGRRRRRTKKRNGLTLEQEGIDANRRRMASDIIDALHVESLSRAIEVAKLWCETAAQEACNAAYWRGRCKLVEARSSNMP